MAQLVQVAQVSVWGHVELVPELDEDVLPPAPDVELAEQPRQIAAARIATSQCMQRA